MSFQRRRGQNVKVWRTRIVKDGRGNDVIEAYPNNPHVVRAASIPQRSSKAEVPGQQQINVTRLILDPNLPDVNLWSRVEYDGRMWDVAAPPQYHYGSRRTRHWSVDIRERP